LLSAGHSVGDQFDLGVVVIRVVFVLVVEFNVVVLVISHRAEEDETVVECVRCMGSSEVMSFDEELYDVLAGNLESYIVVSGGRSAL
jgi:hypothetical protein